MRAFVIWHKGSPIGTVPAASDRAALVRVALDLGLDPESITGTYRLPVEGDSPIFAVEVG